MHLSFFAYLCARDYNSFIVWGDQSLFLFALSPFVEQDHANEADRDRLLEYLVPEIYASCIKTCHDVLHGQSR